MTGAVSSDMGELSDTAWAAAWRMEVEVAWGDCDDAGIVFYPHFFRWMDTAFHKWLRTLGSSHRQITRDFALIGLPIVEANANFRSPVSYDETFLLAVRIEAWMPRRFRVAYRGAKLDGTIVFDGHEVRAPATREPVTGKLKGTDIGPQFKALFGNFTA